MDTRAEVERLHQVGFTALQIAHSLRLSPQAVYLHLKALGVTPNRRPKAARA